MLNMELIYYYVRQGNVLESKGGNSYENDKSWGGSRNYTFSWVTQIIPGEFKGRLFKKGHIIKEEDIEKLLSIG